MTLVPHPDKDELILFGGEHFTGNKVKINVASATQQCNILKIVCLCISTIIHHPKPWDPSKDVLFATVLDFINMLVLFPSCYILNYNFYRQPSNKIMEQNVTLR